MKVILEKTNNCELDTVVSIIFIQKKKKVNVKFMKKQSFIVPQNWMESLNCCWNILSGLQTYFSIIWASFTICQAPYLVIYLYDDSLQGAISITITLFNEHPVYLHPPWQLVSISFIHCQPTISIAGKASLAAASWQPGAMGNICSALSHHCCVCSHCSTSDCKTTAADAVTVFLPQKVMFLLI